MYVVNIFDKKTGKLCGEVGIYRPSAPSIARMLGMTVKEDYNEERGYLRQIILYCQNLVENIGIILKKNIEQQ